MLLRVIKANKQMMNEALQDICACVDKPIVLIIDEVDSATNNQVFLDFLAQLRAGYMDRDIYPAFHSVILAGVHDVKNLKRKIRPEEVHKINSPWNIAADFKVDMSFLAQEIAEMLHSLLFMGKAVAYNYYESSINIATMFGFVKNQNNTMVVANRIFEIWLYNYYLSTAEMHQEEMYTASLRDKNQLLIDYLDAYHQNKGYMLSFNFNKNKRIGVHEIVIGDKTLIEAVV